jgi:hypothetical protein
VATRRTIGAASRFSESGLRLASRTASLNASATTLPSSAMIVANGYSPSRVATAPARNYQPYRELTSYEHNTSPNSGTLG